jgi:hypothetical protein
VTSTDEARLAELADALADGVEAALPGWVARVVRERTDRIGADELDAAGRRAVALVVPAIRDLLALDADAQPTTPLAVVRRAVVVPTGLLDGVGLVPVDRDPEAVRLHPDDVHNLTPASFADLAPELAEPGLAWGAAKAFVHLQRRRAGADPR